jgi:uncharacterized protein YggE
MNNENIKFRAWQTGLTVGILLAVFLAVLVIKEIKSISYVGQSASTPNTISVTGEGEQFATPDIATFSFGVTETAKTVTEAQTAATTRMNAALKALSDAGIDKKDIQTSSYNINPHYEYQTALCNSSYCPGGKQVLTGYDVSQNVTVKVRKLDQAGTIFATIGGLNVQNVNGLDFSVDNPDAVKAAVRKQAIDKAEAKARELASQLGVHLVRIVSFNEDGNYPQPYYAKGMAMDAAAPRAQANVAPEIPAGQQKVTSNVTITYEIR